jgi:hypothetical protein
MNSVAPQQKSEPLYVDRPFRLVLAEFQRSTRMRQIVLRQMSAENEAAGFAAQRLIRDVLRGKVAATSPLFNRTARELASEDLI